MSVSPSPLGIPVTDDGAAHGSHAAPTIRTTVLLPAFNEEAGLAVVLAKLQRTLDDSYELLVIDDGSTDKTAMVAELMGARLVRHATNQGKGAAITTGMSVARGEKLIFIDADDTYPVEMIPAIASALDEADVVITARRDGMNISPFNRLGNTVFRFVIRHVAGSPVRDPLTGLYGLRREVAEGMQLRSRGFGVEAEMVIKAGRMGVRIVDMPIEYSRRIGQSKLNPIRDGLVISWTIASLIGYVPAVRAVGTQPVLRTQSSQGPTDGIL